MASNCLASPTLWLAGLNIIMPSCPERFGLIEWTDLETMKSIVILCLKSGADPPLRSPRITLFEAIVTTGQQQRNVCWNCLSRNRLWACLTGGNLYHFSEVTDSLLAQPWWQAFACCQGCARRLWKSLYSPGANLCVMTRGGACVSDWSGVNHAHSCARRLWKGLDSPGVNLCLMTRGGACVSDWSGVNHAHSWSTCCLHCPPIALIIISIGNTNINIGYIFQMRVLTGWVHLY